MTTSDPDLLDEIDAHARRSDPTTSHDAARSVDVKRGQALVLEMVRQYGPCTDDYLCTSASMQRLTISPSGVRTRRKELADKGLVVAVGTGKTASGRAARIWAAA